VVLPSLTATRRLALDHPREGVRYEAALALTRSGDRRGLRELLLCLEARDPLVRNAVADALAALSEPEREVLFVAAGLSGTGSHRH
jgi:HEAT repeat protein